MEILSKMKTTTSTAFFIAIFGVAIGWIHASSSASFTDAATDGNPAPESIEILGKTDDVTRLLFRCVLASMYEGLSVGGSRSMKKIHFDVHR